MLISNKVPYEILPSAGIIFVCLSLPIYATYAINRIGYGKPYRRTLITSAERRFFMRDQRLTGNAHKTVGLEAIPDRKE